MAVTLRPAKIRPVDAAGIPGTHDLRALLAAAPDRYEIGPTDAGDTALLHFTSGTTGTPKGAIHAHEADARPIFEHDENMLAKVEEIGQLVRTWGYPEQAAVLSRKSYMSFRKFADSIPRDRYSPIRGDQAELDLGGLRLLAIHCPGHTEGLVCLHLAESGGLLFSSDHVLERITPNPTVYIPPFRGRRTGRRIQRGVVDETARRPPPALDVL